MSACGSGSSDDDTTEAADSTAPATSTTATTAVTSTVPATEDRPLVITSTNIWRDVVGAVVCDDLAEVEFVIPAGADSHEYEPALSDRARLAEADLIVVNGLDLEEGLMPTIDAVADGDGVPVFAITDNVPELIEFDTGESDEGDDHGHGTGDDHGHGDDPHVWFDPVGVAAALAPLADAIASATGLDRDRLAACADAYGAELLETADQMNELLAVVPAERRLLVTTHESLGYLADRFDFEILGTVLPTSSTLAESNPADLEDLARAIERAQVPAVFAEAEISSAGLDSLASRVGDVEVIALPTESLGEPGSETATYIDFLLTVATIIAAALGE